MIVTPSNTDRRQRLKPEERRENLIVAAIETLAKDGAKGATLRQTCKRAQVAPGLVAHFFGGWQELLLAAYDRLTGDFTEAVEAIRAAEGLSDTRKLEATIDLFFADDWTAAAHGDAYVALWALSRTEVDLRTRMNRHHADLHRSIASILAPLCENPFETAEALILQLNGIWMEMILNPTRIRPDRARDLAYTWASRLLPNLKHSAEFPRIRQ